MTGSLVAILIPAVGGQGGGVLAEWIVDAATIEGLAVHSTSIPGVAQRTGSTTYYVELYAGPPGDPPAFSLYPVPGAVDVLLAPEFLEVGRAIEAGMPSPARTTIVASTHRLYSIHEKMATGRSIYPADQLETAARALSREFLGFDGLAVAREHRTEVNAVLLGALAGSGVAPVRPESFRKAIERKGVQVEANLRGFDAGVALALDPARRPAAVAEPKRPFRAPAAFAEALAALPGPLRPLVGEALTRLIDYQDVRYATLYLERLAPFVGIGDPPLAVIVARHLALWMTYEDAIRVADLKTRAGRLARIRAEAGAADAEIVVTDYLKPDLDELYGILPYRLVAPVARWAERRWPHGLPTVAQHVRTTSVLGFLRLWLLARCRRLRPSSYRARRERDRMERWLTAVRHSAQWSGDLASEVARAAQLMKGYGDVRRRMAGLLDHLLQTVLQAAELEARRGAGVPAATQLAATYRRLVLQGPEGETRATALGAEVLAHLEKNDPDAALAAVKAAA
jgi:indolepyruvate ferredoxin oxidoreductase, beta subunit